MQTLINKMTLFKVYMGKNLVDSVFFLSSMTEEEVKRALIVHDGYSEEIRISKERSKNGY